MNVVVGKIYVEGQRLEMPRRPEIRDARCLEGGRGCHPRNFFEIYMQNGAFSCILSAYDHPQIS